MKAETNKMKILAHRGYWNDKIKDNSPEALHSALELGFGFESDLRDLGGELVVSHNIADASAPKAEEVFKSLAEFGDKYCFAINIKADGLKNLLADSLARYKIKNYFVFDMSIPQMIEFREKGLVYFTRQSEVEPSPVLYDDAAGVWLDGFWRDEWITKDLIGAHITKGKAVAIVSPELHARPHLEFWRRLRSFRLDFSRIYLCTNYPLEAKEFFNAGNEEEK